MSKHTHLWVYAKITKDNGNLTRLRLLGENTIENRRTFLTKLYNSIDFEGNNDSHYHENILRKRRYISNTPSKTSWRLLGGKEHICNIPETLDDTHFCDDLEEDFKDLVEDLIIELTPETIISYHSHLWKLTVEFVDNERCVSMDLLGPNTKANRIQSLVNLIQELSPHLLVGDKYNTPENNKYIADNSLIIKDQRFKFYKTEDHSEYIGYRILLGPDARFDLPPYLLDDSPKRPYVPEKCFTSVENYAIKKCISQGCLKECK